MTLTEHAVTVTVVLVGTGAMFAITLALWVLEVLRKQRGPHIRSRGREVHR